MNTEIINAIVYLIMPIVIAAAVYYYKKIEQTLPEKQRAALQEIAKLAVHSIEQQFSSAPGENKSNYAINLVGKMFDALKLPIPEQTLIENAIEAAVFEMNMFQSRGNDDDLLPIINPRSPLKFPPVATPPPPPPTQLPPSTTLSMNKAPGGDNHEA